MRGAGKWLAAALLAIGSLFGFGEAQGQAPFITNAQWVETPTGADFHRFYPEAASRQSVVGRAVLECEVVRGGRLRCDTNEEAPLGWGFGAAAIAISGSFRMSPTLSDGTTSEGRRVRVPIRFRLSNSIELPEDAPAELRESLLASVAPIWEAAPSFETVNTAYPSDARRRGIRGRGVLSCVVNDDRTLGCETSSETPVGHGFGEAAQRLAGHFRLAEDQAIPAAARLIVPINFGASVLETPISQIFPGDQPLPLPSPAPIVVASLYPDAAKRERVGGLAVVVCTLSATSVPSECSIQREEPSGRGFGEAVARWMRTLPYSADDLDLLAGDKVQIGVQFDPELIAAN